MIEALLLIPVILSLLCFAFRKSIVNKLSMLSYSFCTLVFAIYICIPGALEVLPVHLLRYFDIDPLGRLFTAILACVQFLVAVYSLYYFKKKQIGKLRETLFAIFFMLFSQAAHLAFTWVFVEATTLFGALLIYAERERSALEAAWKYIFICSIGISFSFIGIVLLGLSGAGESLFYSDLIENAQKANPFLLKLSYVFILVGFGTKMGLSPVHAWLPDAHSEAPSPVSALLSGVLLNVSAIVLIRFTMVMAKAGLADFSGVLLIIMGALSLVVGASSIVYSTNYKRMLAYSSIENMGLVAIGIGIGGGAIFASLFQIMIHSFAKSGLFLTSGNIFAIYGTKRIDNVRGLVRRERITAYLWLLGFIALSGFPPFGGFLAKFFFARAIIDSGYAFLFVPVFLLLVIIVAGMSLRVMNMVFGSRAHSEKPVRHMPLFSYAPQVLILLVLILLGLSVPEPVRDIIEQAKNFILYPGVIL